MTVGELRTLLEQFPDYWNVYGKANADEWEPDNRFNICNVELKTVEHKQYQETVILMDWNVL
jgi:hypothetical protein